ncbi:MAG: DEAD/DEAH box helicase [Candidatus Cloacimonetes bacterium]|nr:DEAD/DEAH box helicase [Candidatus Cloacimonadota bacterium]
MTSRNNQIVATDFIAFDIETTGLVPTECEIIELAAVRFHNGEVESTFNTFIKPQSAVPNFIKQLTHITEKQLAAGLPVRDGLSQLVEFVGNDILVCHNAPFDIEFTNHHLAIKGLPRLANRCYDTLEISRCYLPFVANHKLQTMCERFAIPLEGAHRAYVDAEATGKLLLHLQAYILDNIPLQLNGKLSVLVQHAELFSDFGLFLNEVLEHQRKVALLTNYSKTLQEAPINSIEADSGGWNTLSMDEVFGETGKFSETFSAYEIRQGQIDMAVAVEQAFEDKSTLLVEAGTGVGKSFAYMVPALQYSLQTGNRVVVTTNTKNLQEQLFFKDIPALKECLSIPVKAVMLKGRDNYICQRRWEELDFQKQLTPIEAAQMMRIVVWQHFTNTGDITENTSTGKYGGLWRKIAADRHFCLGNKCGFYGNCYLMRVRRKAIDANLVVVNHALMLADLMNENNTLGDYSHLVIDEAHHLPEAVSNHMGISIGYTDVNGLLNSIYSKRIQFMGGMMIALKTAVIKSMVDNVTEQRLLNTIEELMSLVEDKRKVIAAIFTRLGKLVEQQGDWNKLRIRPNSSPERFKEDILLLAQLLTNFHNGLRDMRDVVAGISADVFPNHDIQLQRLEGLAGRCKELSESVLAFADIDFNNAAVWVSCFKTKEYPNGMLNLAPLNVDEQLQKLLYPKMDSLIMTSATLALRGKFRFFTDRIGLDEEDIREVIVDSPFDYGTQSRAIVPTFLPDTMDQFFPNQAGNVLLELVSTNRIGTMVLFTSYGSMNTIYDRLSQPLFERDIPLFIQNKLYSRTMLLNEFREKGKAVLLGTSSFWEGVDIPGEALQLLVLYKLPFAVPSDPVVEAIHEKLEREKKNSFMHYTLPMALLKYKQGFGRLIRTKEDRGVVLILDKRVTTKRYGKYFEEVIPAKTCRIDDEVQLIDTVTSFFKL